MTFDDYLAEFKADWRLLGRSQRTAENYALYLLELVGETSPDEISLRQVKEWLANSSSAETARYRARAVRAFARWAQDNDGPSWSWWQSVPLKATPPRPQVTVSEEQYRESIAKSRRLRHRCVIELLWSTGLRVSELARLQVSDLDLQGGFAVVATSKTGRPRVVPLSEAATRSCRRLIGNRDRGSLLEMSPHAIQLLLRRLGLPSAHAWRRGWAVQALRSGVSEASVRAAAGWSSGAMVARYTSAVSGQLAIDEFRHARSR